MDAIRALGPLALGSRLRRLTDRLFPDGQRVYRQLDFDFEPRWFALFHLLSQRAPLSVQQAADALGVSHAAISQLVRELQRKRLVSSTRDPRDERRRRLVLTDRARELLPRLHGVWNDFEAASQALIDESGHDLLAAVGAIERALDARGFADRIFDHSQRRAPDVEIVDYRPEHRADFERLNRMWLERGFRVDAEDQKIFDDPERAILEPGGSIWIARARGRAVGCCGLLPREPGSWELIKLAVDERDRGSGIGEQLLRVALRRARQLQADRVVLETSSRLAPALRLYRRLGFRERPHAAMVHDRADLWLELALDASASTTAPERVRIAPFQPDLAPQVVQLIVGIQAGEFSIPITAADQPDLDDIPRVYQRDGAFFVALDAQRVVGTIGLIRFSPGAAAIRKMFVARDQRGSGLANRLLDAAVAFARASGIDTLALGTLSILHAAHRFYEKAGFERIDVDELPDAFPRMPVDDRFYRLRLESSAQSDSRISK